MLQIQMVAERLNVRRGIYWRDQGFSACEDVPSNNKFRLSDGTEVQNTSSSITRGFKTGYNMIETKGESETGVTGYGGSGATGGNGGSGVTGGRRWIRIY